MMLDITFISLCFVLAVAGFFVIFRKARQSEVAWLNDGEDDRRQRLKELGE